MRIRDYENEAKKILDQMTTREKVDLIAAHDFWHMQGNEKYGLPNHLLTDGPHGLRKLADGASAVQMNKTLPSTAFPTASASACSFDPELAYEMGTAIGDECTKEKVGVILGPGLNHKRSPICGRNFEYMSEEPLLAGKMAGGIAKGIEDRGIGSCLKHYACNSQERARLNTNSVVDERALHEIYLRQFQTVVEDVQPAMIMTSYNRINNVFASDSKYLMEDVARGMWGYEGAFVTDWGAVNQYVEGFENGLDLEMPGGTRSRVRAVMDGYLDGKVSMKRIDATALRLIEISLRSSDAHAGKFNGGKIGEAAADMDENMKMAEKVAENSIVLLKNDDNILPLKKGAKVGVFGSFAENPRYQGAGSSGLKPYKVSTPLEALQAAGVDYEYEEGYKRNRTAPNEEKIAAAVKVAAKMDVCVVFAGLPNSAESEGYDRNKLDMPESHNELIRAVAKANPNTVVVLQMGSPVLMPWLQDVKGVLCAYLAGSSNGTAITHILLGDVNPSGHLAETFPLSLADNPSYGEFGDPFVSFYKESIFTGYRYYDTANKPVLFPFGYGLSYTTFEYSDLKVRKTADGAEPNVTVSVDVTNTGSVTGKEVVQIYVGQKDPVIFKPKKELKAFRKIELAPGETRTVTMELDSKAFDYWNVNVHQFVVAEGEYIISVARNVSEVVLFDTVTLSGTPNVETPDYRAVAPEYYDLSGGWVAKDIPDASFEAVLGEKIDRTHSNKPYTMNSTVSELFDGKLWNIGERLIDLIPMDRFDANVGFFTEMAPDMPIKAIRDFNFGIKSESVEKLVNILNSTPKDLFCKKEKND